MVHASETLFNFIRLCDSLFFLTISMGKQKKNEELKVVMAEYKVSMHCNACERTVAGAISKLKGIYPSLLCMHCNACERTVARAISKLKGVEKFMTDMNKHKVAITGRIDPQKVLKKLKKKTGKRVEMVLDKKNEESPKVVTDEGNAATGEFGKPVGDLALFDCCKDNELLTLFSDENPNACSIM